MRLSHKQVQSRHFVSNTPLLDPPQCLTIDQSSKKCTEDLQVGPSRVCAMGKVLGTRVCYLTWLLSLNPRTEGEW